MKFKLEWGWGRARRLTVTMQHAGHTTKTLLKAIGEPMAWSTFKNLCAGNTKHIPDALLWQLNNELAKACRTTPFLINDYLLWGRRDSLPWAENVEDGVDIDNHRVYSSSVES